MEEVEKANRAAVQSCIRVIGLLSQPKDKISPGDISVETGEAVSRFKRLVSLLNGSVGHGKVRVVKVPPISNHKMFADNHFLSKMDLALESKNLVLDSSPKNLLQISQRSFTDDQFGLQASSSSSRYEFVQCQQQNGLKFQLGQQMSLQADIFRRSHSAINLKFENSNCTPSVSTARSFLSSVSMDGSVVSLDGKSAFRLISGPASSNTGNLHPPLKRKYQCRGEDGNGKCATTGRCHCSKKRKLRSKRTIKVPAISDKSSDIPPDEYSWRKYGQKPIKGSPHPRQRQMGKEVAKVVAAFRRLESRGPPKNNSDQVAYSSKPSVIREFKKDISGIKGNENSHLVQEVVAKDDTTVTTDKQSESLCSPKSNSNQVNSCQPSATLEPNEATNGIKYYEKSNQGQELSNKQVAEVITDKMSESNCAPKNNSNQDSSQLQSLCAPKGNSNQDSSQLPESPGSKNAICNVRDNETSHQEQQVLDIRIISFDQVGSANKHAAKKSNQKLAASKSDNAGKAQSHCLVPHTRTLAIEKHHASVAEASGSVNKPVIAHNSHLASISNSSLTHGKASQPDKKMHHHNTDDSCSVASSAASFISFKGRRTVGNAPSFKCSERAEKRKEYYTKLEQKHQAMEAEKLQIEARIKEEQDTALKEFRKNLIVKANPLPSFYAKGPPPKAELKKVPPTRAKSPKFSRRRSFSDANSLQGEKCGGGACDRLHQHALCPIVKSSKGLPNSPKAVKGKGTKTNEGSKLSTLSSANQMTDTVTVQT